MVKVYKNNSDRSDVDKTTERLEVIDNFFNGKLVGEGERVMLTYKDYIYFFSNEDLEKSDSAVYDYIESLISEYEIEKVEGQFCWVTINGISQ